MWWKANVPKTRAPKHLNTCFFFGFEKAKKQGQMQTRTCMYPCTSVRLVCRYRHILFGSFRIYLVVPLCDFNPSRTMFYVEVGSPSQIPHQKTLGHCALSEAGAKVLAYEVTPETRPKMVVHLILWHQTKYHQKWLCHEICWISKS